MCHTPSGGLCIACARLTAKGEPQTRDDFIAAFPERDGVSVYACALFVYDLRDGMTYILGETSSHIWNVVKPQTHLVLSVLYTGDDRNEAIRIRDGQ